NVCMVGYTDSNTGTDIATLGSHQSTFGGGLRDVFLVQFNSLGVRQWGTYYGGTGEDTGASKAVDASGNVYLIGSTSSTTGISTVGAHQSTYGGGGRDAFFVQFNSTGERQWGTYYGGTSDDFGVSNIVDASGKMYFTGGTQSSTGIATSGIHQSTFGGNYDAFLVQFECVASTGTDVQASCNSIMWLDGNTYTSSTNTPTFTIPGGEFFGCDSVVTLNFSYNPIISTDVQTACNSFTWINGNTYTSSINTPTFTIQGGAASGCDSVVKLNLTITTINNTTSLNNDTIIANETGATYQWLDCNNGNAIISGETNQSYNPVLSGDYMVVLTKNGCSDSSACVNVVLTGISELVNSFVKIYPNPTTTDFIIELANYLPRTQLSIVSVEGKTVYTNNTINTNKIIVNAADWSKGIYVVKITDEKNTQILKLIKQ
ncbi:MAG TPA: T9SS type A sorting domain-containing protein, partial [Vicingus sp.]|nr:T9SS type A sorting domain-containing protein [Vicingus sp.]